MRALRDIFEADEFQSGLVVGFIGAFLAVLAAASWRWMQRGRARAARGAGVAGVAFGVASLVALHGVGPFDRVVSVPAALVAAVGLFFAAGAVSSFACERDERRVVLNAVFVAPGAWLLAEHTDLAGPAWLRATVLVAAIVVGPLAASSDRRLDALGAGPVLLLVSVGGLYATVPDTEQTLVLLGVALPIAFLGIPGGFVRLGAGGANVAVALMLWAGAQGAVGRPASIVGALGTFALLATVPIGWLLPDRPLSALSKLPRLGALIVIGCVQIVLALYAAQIVGPEHQVTTAALLLVPAVLGALVAAWLLAPLTAERGLGIRTLDAQTVAGARPRRRA